MIYIRKGLTWDGAPAWRWTCDTCPPTRGRARGGCHRAVPRFGWERLRRLDAYNRCRRAALNHLASAHRECLQWTPVHDRKD